VKVPVRLRIVWLTAVLFACIALAAPKKGVDLWSLKPVVRPAVPSGLTKSANPIDAFIAAELKARGLQPAGPADKLTLLRRVHFDLIGLPPTPAEQDAFLKDESPEAYEKLVDRLLASEQHGVRYGRHWLDVLRYADVDERMYAAPGIHLWRDWVIHALNKDMPYDEFVRTQLTGYRNERTQVSGIGIRSRIEPRPDDMFALGFLARGGVVRDNKDSGELPIVAVETVSTAFMGLTVGCAKCHDHMYDPIAQKDFYAMKALFDPLVVKKETLAPPGDIFANGDAADEVRKKRAAAEEPLKAQLDAIAGPLRKRLEEERVAMLPPDAQAAVRKPEKQRTLEEQRLVDDYTVPLRVDPIKVKELLPADLRKKVDEIEKQLTQLAQGGGGGGGRRGGGGALPVFWTVEIDKGREKEPSYILSSGEPDRPEKDKPVEPGWPFAPAKIDFRDGRIEAFADWLSAPENPLFARVAVNRLWQWHFGEGLHKTSSDFGTLGGAPSNQKLLDWLASEFVARKFSMKDMHKLMVMSETYRRASDAEPALLAANSKIDSEDTYLWRFRLERLEAEPVWDSILASAGTLDSSLGGASFDITPPVGPRGGGAGGGRGGAAAAARPANRRAAYMVRGFSTSREVMADFLESFDVDDGRAPCPLRTRTVTAPQSLFLMNGEMIETAAAKLAERLKKESGEEIGPAVDLEFRITLGRPPSPKERDEALSMVQNDPARLKDLAWLLFNMDEFIYVR
jgi:Protein of unknown function (DUF1553)/Protein of unknown function (DUF1549)